MATLRVDKDTFTNERDVVKEERRMRVDNQPYGRLNEIIYDQAFTVHPYKHATIGSMEDLEAASVEDVRDFYQHLLRAGERDAGARRRLRYGAGAARWSRSISGACRRRSAQCRATSRRSRRRPRRSASRCRSRGRCRPSSSRTTSPTTATPTRIRCTSRPRCCPDGQSVAHLPEAGLREADGGGGVRQRQPHRGSEPVLRRRDRAAGAQPRRRSPTPLIAELDRLKTEPITEHELQRTKNQFARDYILGRESNQQKAQTAGARASSSTTTSRRRTASSTSSRTSRSPTSSASRRPTSAPRTAWCSR